MAGLVTVLITSGWRFHERFDEIVPWPDLIILSLDLPSPEHDRCRGMPGLYDSVERAIQQIGGRAGGPRVAVNSVISRLNAHVVPDLVRWAAARSVPIYLHPIETSRPGGDAHGSVSKAPLAVPDSDMAKLFRRLIALKAAGYPVANSYPYLRTFSHGKRPYRCHARKVCLQLWPNGDLVDCLNRGQAVVNVLKSPLPEVLGRPAMAVGFSQIARDDPHGDSHDVLAISYSLADGAVWDHSGRHLNNLYPFECCALIHGTTGYARMSYVGPIELRGPERTHAGEVRDLYEAGAVRNIAAFYRQITEGRFENATVPRAVDGALTTILSREATMRRVRLTMDELIQENRRLELDLKGLKT